ncbi:lipopolysaccharide biosynthesis protein [Pedobacter sp. UYP1]|uniref:lipopolysaccharide biosynthesis protein n=1 Tax=Pedobacter sp. UYP1 TaxID=1756396 RepID=UPI00339AC826
MSVLKDKAIKGVAWSFVDNIANSGITFIVGIVLARLLSPAEFGILGMITVFIAVSNSIIDSGFSQALIRKIDVKGIDYNTVFFFNLAIGFVLFLVLFFSSPYIGEFFKEPRLVNVTRVMASILIINALSIIHRTILTKNINFKLQTKISLAASLLSGIVGIGMAYYGFGVWSLVGQILSKQLLYTVLMWALNIWWPKIEFSKKSFNEMFNFGSKLLVSGLIDTIYKNIYYLIIGRYYSAYELGQYSRAEQFSIIFSSNLTVIIQRVSYPVLSSIQDDIPRLKEAYRKVIKSTMLVTFTLMLGLAAIAKPLIIILIGEKWLMAVPFLQIICLSEMLYPLHAINLNILNVKGHSGIILKLEVMKKFIAVPVILAGIFMGIQYMLWGSVIASILSYFLNSYFSAPFLKYSTKEQLKDIIPGLIIALIVSSIMWTFTLLTISNWAILSMQFAAGILLTIGLCEIVKLSEYLEMKSILEKLLKRNL